IGALITAVLFGVFSRTYERPYLSQWARAWSAMCVMLVGAALGAALWRQPAESMERTVISAVSSVAAYLQIAWLLLGAAWVASPERGEKMRAQEKYILFGAVLV